MVALTSVLLIFFTHLGYAAKTSPDQKDLIVEMRRSTWLTIERTQIVFMKDEVRVSTNTTAHYSGGSCCFLGVFKSSYSPLWQKYKEEFQALNKERLESQKLIGRKIPLNPKSAERWTFQIDGETLPESSLISGLISDTIASINWRKWKAVKGVRVSSNDSKFILVQNLSTQKIEKYPVNEICLSKTRQKDKCLLNEWGVLYLR